MAEVVVAVLVAAGISWWWWRRRRHGGQVLPPSPAGWLPVIGHLHLLRPPVHRRLQELASSLGAPLMHVLLGSTSCVVASTAEAASELIRGHEASISERPVTAVARQFAYGSSGFAFAHYDAHWRFMKRLCMSELLGPRTVEQLRPVRRAGTVTLLRDALLASASASVMDLTRHLIRLSNTSIIRMVASTVPGSVTDEAQDLVKEVAELVGAFNAADYITRGWDVQGLGRRAADVHRRFDALLEDIITHKERNRSRQAQEGHGHGHGHGGEGMAIPQQADKHKKVDLLDILLDKAEDQSAEVKLTRDNIKAFIIDVVTAGSDTSAAMVEWMLVELLNHPEALRKVRREIDDAVGADRIVSEADLPRLPYLQAAYKETLRLHPAAPIAHRQSSQQMTLGGFTVPPQSAVFVNVWAIGRDPAFWEDPEAFRPERFMPGGQAEGLDPRGQHFHFMPFGSGRRGCPGMGLAMQSVPAVLAALVQCFHWKLDNKIDMEESDGLVCARKNPLLLRPVARLNPFPAVV